MLQHFFLMHVYGFNMTWCFFSTCMLLSCHNCLVDSLLITSRCIWSKIYLFYLASLPNNSCNKIYSHCLVIVFHLGRTWRSCLWKLTQLKEDMVCLKKLVYLKLMDYQRHPCTLQAVQETIMQLFRSTLSRKSPPILGSFNHHCMLMQIPMEVEGHCIYKIESVPWVVRLLFGKLGITNLITCLEISEEPNLWWFWGVNEVVQTKVPVFSLGSFVSWKMSSILHSHPSPIFVHLWTYTWILY